MISPPDILACRHCGKSLELGKGEFYLVRIEAMADPSSPRFEIRDVADIAKEVDALLKRLKDMPEEEAVSQVFMRIFMYLCNTCYCQWINDATNTKK
jgi:hypothetical protein